MKRIILSVLLAVASIIPSFADSAAMLPEKAGETIANVDSLTEVQLARIQADKEIALAAMAANPANPANYDNTDMDWTGIIIVTLVCFMPILIVFLYLAYRKHLEYQRKKLNDQLVINLAKQGQQITPEMIKAIRLNEEDQKADKKERKPGSQSYAYQRLCTGGVLILSGLILLIRNRVMALIFMICGLFVVAQGLAAWLSNRNEQRKDSELPTRY